jgi:hypothetical protein
MSKFDDWLATLKDSLQDLQQNTQPTVETAPLVIKAPVFPSLSESPELTTSHSFDESMNISQSKDTTTPSADKSRQQYFFEKDSLNPQEITFVPEAEYSPDFESPATSVSPARRRTPVTVREQKSSSSPPAQVSPKRESPYLRKVKLLEESTSTSIKDVTVQKTILNCPLCSSPWSFEVEPSLKTSYWTDGISGGRDLWKEAFRIDDFVDQEFPHLNKTYDLSKIFSVTEVSNSKASDFSSAVLLIISKKAEEALPFLQKCLNSKIPSALIYWWKGLALLDLSRHEEAKNACRQCFASLPLSKFGLILHWHWAILYNIEETKSKKKLSVERELRELKRIQNYYGGGTKQNCCFICGRQ